MICWSLFLYSLFCWYNFISIAFFFLSRDARQLLFSHRFSFECWLVIGFASVRFTIGCIFSSDLRHLDGERHLESRGNKAIPLFIWVQCRFCISTFHVWLKKICTIFHPVRSKIPTNSKSFKEVFSCFASSSSCNYFQSWLVHWIFCILYN